MNKINQTQLSLCVVRLGMFPSISAPSLLSHRVREGAKELVVMLAGGRSVSLRISKEICPDVEQKAVLAQLPGGILLQGSGSEAHRKPRA